MSNLNVADYSKYDILLKEFLLKFSFLGNKIIYYDYNLLLEFCGILYENCFSTNIQKRKESFSLLKAINVLLIRLKRIDIDIFTMYEALELAYGNYNALKDIPIKSKSLDLYHFFNRKLSKYLLWNGFSVTKEQFNLIKNLEKSSIISFSAPTSFGKSMFIRKMIQEQINCGKIKNNIIFMVPTKALINENYKKFMNLLKNNNINISIYPDSYESGVQNLFIFTPERTLQFEKIREFKIDLVVLDEGQYLTSSQQRNEKFYIALRKVLKTFPDCNLWISSPILTSPQTLLESLGYKKEGQMNFNWSLYKNPLVSTLFYFYDLSKKIVYTKFYLKKEFLKLDNKKVLPKNINDLIYQIGNNNSGTTLIYANSKDKVRKYANEFKKFLDDKEINFYDSKKDTQKRLTLNAFSGSLESTIDSDYELVSLIKKGIGYHHSFMTNWSKLQIEKFIDLKLLKFVFCTSTLLEGVDFNVDDLIILSTRQGKSTMSNFNFNNLIGRVGRFTLKNPQRFGRVHIIVNTKITTLQNKIDNFINKDITIDYKNSIEKVANSDDSIKKVESKIYSILANEIVLNRNDFKTFSYIDEHMLKKAESNVKVKKIIDNFNDENLLKFLKINSFISIETYKKLYKVLTTKFGNMLEKIDFNDLETLSSIFIEIYEEELKENYFKSGQLFFDPEKIKKMINYKLNKYGFSFCIGKHISSLKHYNYSGNKLNKSITNYIGLYNVVIDHALPYYFDNFLSCIRVVNPNINSNLMDIILFGTDDKKIIKLCKKNIPSELAEYIQKNGIKYSIENNNVIINDLEKYRQMIRNSNKLSHYIDFFDKN